MGSFGERAFENDTALDWISEIEQDLANRIHTTLIAYKDGTGDAQEAEAAAAFLYELTSPIESLPLQVPTASIFMKMSGYQAQPTIVDPETTHCSRLSLDFYAEELCLFSHAIDAMTKYRESDLDGWRDPEEKARCLDELIDWLRKKSDALERVNRQ
jgi:hypothetical protein